MATVKALNNQSLFDLCIQEHGNLKPLFEFAQANNISVTDDLQVGEDYQVISSKSTNVQVVNFYKKNVIKPATNAPVLVYSAIGIGEMVVGDTNKVG